MVRSDCKLPIHQTILQHSHSESETTLDIALNVVQQGHIQGGPAWWELADRSGVNLIGVPDSPALLRELYISCALCAQHTSRARIMPGVTNPISRDPSVTASALFTLNELAPGRVALGIGTGDSAAWGVGKKPAKLDHLREYMLAVRALLNGEEAHYEGRVIRAKWAGFSPPVRIPMIVAVAGPRIIRMSCEIADGMLLSMGFGPENIDYVRSLVDEGCAAAGRDPSELELWWNTEVVFGDSAEEARARGMGVSTEWLTMGSLEGKQIPEDLRDALRTFNSDIHDLQAEYQSDGREQALIGRAKDLGLYDWLLSRAAGFWGTPVDIAARLNEFAEMGLDKWMFYVGRSEKDRMTDLHKLCDEVLPLLKA